MFFYYFKPINIVFCRELIFMKYSETSSPNYTIMSDNDYHLRNYFTNKSDRYYLNYSI